MAYAEPVNLTTLDSLVGYVNDITGGQFAIMISLSVFLVCIFFLSINNFRFNDSLVASSFLSASVTALMYLGGWVNGTVLFWTIGVLFIVSSMALYTRNIDIQ